MEADRWERLAEWHNAWLSADADARVRLAERFAAEQPELAVEVEALASASLELAGFLETPALALAAQDLADEDPLLAPGTMVGPYRIAALLAQGGAGDVYRATDVRLRRDVALKVLANERSGYGGVERFLQEAEITASLDHPNVVRIFDVGCYGDRAYLVVELLEGETLRERLERGPAPLEEARGTALDVARGLAAAHEAGLVHRDLKPENVFLVRGGVAKILDFGIAKPGERNGGRSGLSTQTGFLLGTAGYVAPEQVRGDIVDPRADLFALGAVLFEMLSGERAFARDNLVDTLHAILHDPPGNGRRSLDDLPSAWRAVVARLLEKAAEARFQSAPESVAALEALPESSDGGRLPWSWLPTPQGRLGRVRLPAIGPTGRRAAIAGVTLGVAAVVVGLAWRSRSEGSADAGLAAADGGRSGGRVLAVIPFRSIPVEPDVELLELGMADVLISRLGRLSGLRVLPLTATERLRREDPVEAGRKLGADRVLTGSVQRVGERLRASVQLLSLPDGRAIWTDTIDSRDAGIFEVQDAVVARVLEELAPGLTAEERRRLIRPGTRSPEALEAHLRGRAHLFRATPRDFERAVSVFRQALQLDADYADAWAGLGYAYRMLAQVGNEARPRESFAEAKRAASRALELEPEHPEALATLGSIAFAHDWDYPRSEQLLRESLRVAPDSALARLNLAHLLSNLGRHAEALDEARRLRELDPSWLAAQGLESQFLFFARRYEDALRRADATVQLDPQYPNARVWRSYPLLALGRYEEAWHDCAMAGQLSQGRWAFAEALGGYALARLGRREEAESVLARLRERASERYLPKHHLALVLHALGQDEEALQQLRVAVEERDVFLMFLGVDPKWDELRSASAFRDVLSSVGVLEVSDAIQGRSE